MAHYNRIHEDMTPEEVKADYLEVIKDHVRKLAIDQNVGEDVVDAADEQSDLTVSQYARQLDIPHFNKEQSADDPMLIWANYSLPVYLTTCHHEFLEDALRTIGLKPRSDFCRWHDGLTAFDSVLKSDEYEPSPSEPLVYHMLGMDEHPESLVLTEDDYLEYLVALSQTWDSHHPIASQVRQAVTLSSLIFLGFDLASWDFRVLFWGLIRKKETKHRGAITLQLKPGEEEKKYLRDYLRREALLEIEWGSMTQYTQFLWNEVKK
jgi:hypothetical protein